MSRPPISRSNSSTSLEQTNTEQINQSPNDKPKTEEGDNPPTLGNKPGPQTPFDRVFNSKSQTKRDELDDESDQGGRPQQEKSPQGDQHKSSDKQADTASKGKAGFSIRKVIIPSLKLSGSAGVAPGTAQLKSRAPVSPDSSSGLGSHRTMSPRTGEATQATSHTSSSTLNANTQGQAPSSAPPARPLPSVPQTPSVSTSNAPMSARSATSASGNAKGFPASKLTTRSKNILDSALVNGKIDPADLGYLLVEVQTSGFKQNLSAFDQGTPFMRAGLKVLDFKASNGKTYDSINLIEKFLEPMAERAFSTPECNELRKTVERNYLSVSSAMESAAKGMRPKEMQESEKIKNLMDPVIQPLTTWVCGENENLMSSQFPEVWKSLLLGIDDAVVQWAKNIQNTDMKEIKRLRSEALVAFISTRGLMIIWGEKLQTFGEDKGIDQAKFTSYVNSYFSHRANKFITDIMLTRKDLVGDSFDSKMRGYLKVLGGHKEFVSKAPRENASGRRQLMKSKTLQSTKMPPSNSSHTFNDESTALSPRKEAEQVREIKQKQSAFQRKKFVNEFGQLANLAKISPEFFRAFQMHVEEMSAKAYQKFEKDPVQLCTRYLDKFYVGVLNKDRQAAEKSIRAALATIRHQDIEKIIFTVEKVKSYVKPESELLSLDKQISQQRKIKFLGEFTFYTNTSAISKDFLISFKKYILELSAAEYVKFEATPIASGLAFVEKWYSSFVTTSPSADRIRLTAEKNQLVDALKNTPNASIKGLKDSMAASPTPASDARSVVASPRSNVRLELPANLFEEEEEKAIAAPLSTASIQPIQDSRMPPSSAGDLNFVRKNEISAARRNDFTNKFLELANIHDISDSFNAAFKKHILELSASDYVKFLRNPIANSRDYVNYFYDLPFHQETKQSRADANEDKPAFLHFLLWNEKNNLEAITKLAAANIASTLSAGISTSTASTQPPQDSRTPPVASGGLNSVAKDVESEKTEHSSEPEIFTEPDGNADAAASEKTEES